MDLGSNPILAAIILLGVLIFFHELGHFWIGRLCGIAVESFSIGFGPQILSITRGLTTYRIGLLPLGGYVKFYGMTSLETIPEDMNPKDCFHNADLWKRALTIGAGPFFNIFLAFIIYVVLGTAGLPYANTVIGHIEHNSPAALVGLMPLDEILAVDGQEVRKWAPMRDKIVASANQPLRLSVRRDSEIFEVLLTPEAKEVENIRGEKVVQGRAGIARGRIPAVVHVIRPGLFENLDQIQQIKTSEQTYTIADWYTFQKIYKDVTARQDAYPIEVLVLRNNEPVSLVLDWHESTRLSLEIPGDQGLTHAQLVFIEEADAKYQCPLQKGDRILSWNGVDVESIYDLYAQMALGMEKPKAQVRVLRGDGSNVELDVPLQGKIEQFAEGAKEIFSFPVRFAADMIEPEYALESYAFFPAAFIFAAKETVYQTGFLIRALKDLLSGQLPLKTLGGPVMIAKVAGDSAKAGWKMFLITMALISVNLAVVNMFPIPVLDGGQLVMLSIEGLRRKPLSMKAVENYQKIGFVMILCLIVLATYNDLSRFWTSILRSLNG